MGELSFGLFKRPRDWWTRVKAWLRSKFQK